MIGIDRKHACIGATVSLLLNVHKLTSDTKLPNELAGLFTAESEDCDYKDGVDCSFLREDRRVVKCLVGNCPLGPMVEEASKKTGRPEPAEFMLSKSREQQNKMGFDTTMTFGCSPETYDGPTQGGSIHIGYVGWRKHWNNFKKFFRRQ